MRLRWTEAIKRYLPLALVIAILILSACARPAPSQESTSTEEPTTPATGPATGLPTPTEKAARPLLEYPDVVLGKDNWLFNGEPINELVLDGGLKDTQIQQVVDELRYINDSLKKQGVDFLFLLVPEKRLIYPELMPSRFKESDIPSSYDRLSEALSRAGIDFIDSKSLLLEKKKETGYRLYYMRDQNWNSLGNFYVMQEILAHLSQKHPAPKFDLLSVDTSETRIMNTEVGNDLNQMVQGVSPWYEKGAPEPVYDVRPEPEAPSILWYGSCFSPEVINMLREAWPGPITYVSLWGPYGFPLSLRQDIEQRVAGHKIVVFEIAELYRQHLSRMLVPEPPQIDLTSYPLVYNWQPSNFRAAWKPEGGSTIEPKSQMVAVQANNPDSAPVISTARLLRLEPSKKYYLVIKVDSPAVTGILVDFSTKIGGDYFGAHQQGRFIYEGDNTVVFEFPDQDTAGTVRSIRIHLGDTGGIYNISQIAIYAKPK